MFLTQPLASHYQQADPVTDSVLLSFGGRRKMLAQGHALEHSPGGVRVAFARLGFGVLNLLATQKTRRSNLGAVAFVPEAPGLNLQLEHTCT